MERIIEASLIWCLMFSALFVEGALRENSDDYTSILCWRQNDEYGSSEFLFSTECCPTSLGLEFKLNFQIHPSLFSLLTSDAQASFESVSNSDKSFFQHKFFNNTSRLLEEPTDEKKDEILKKLLVPASSFSSESCKNETENSLQNLANMLRSKAALIYTGYALFEHLVPSERALEQAFKMGDDSEEGIAQAFSFIATNPDVANCIYLYHALSRNTEAPFVYKLIHQIAFFSHGKIFDEGVHSFHEQCGSDVVEENALENIIKKTAALIAIGVEQDSCNLLKRFRNAGKEIVILTEQPALLAEKTDTVFTGNIESMLNVLVEKLNKVPRRRGSRNT